MALRDVFLIEEKEALRPGQIRWWWGEPVTLIRRTKPAPEDYPGEWYWLIRREDGLEQEIGSWTLLNQKDGEEAGRKLRNIVRHYKKTKGQA